MNIMKNLLLTLALVVFTLAGFSQARIQVIHNSADAALESVDIWLDGTLLLDNFKFRTASPFMDAPAGVSITISVKGPDSQDPDNPLWSGSYNLADGEHYIMVAEGIITAAGYHPAVPFDIAVMSGARETATSEDVTDMLTHHGSTDAPALDINEVGLGLGKLVDDISYSEFDGYLELSTKDFLFEVTDASGSPVIDTYEAYFRILGYKGMALTVLTSGFLDPGSNNNGPAFGLWVALAAGGNLVELPPSNPTARVQFIHNSADAAAEVVDVWLNDTKLIDNLEFRTASPFLDLPAGEEITIAVTDSGSPNPDNPLWSGNYTLTLDEKYIMVADGIVSASGYDPAEPFSMEIFPQAREMANMTNLTDILWHHGSTDAPIVDIYEVGTGAGQWVDNLSYTDFAGYSELEPMDYIVEIRDETGINKLAAFKMPLETMGLDGYALTVVASGFLDPENNSGGPALGLWMASAAGGDLVELPVYDPKAHVQFIHNSADAAAGVVDVWLNGSLWLDNLAFRSASPFMDVSAGQEVTIAVKGPDSQDPDNPLWSHVYTFQEDKAYLLVADGIISTSGYDPVKPFDVVVFPNAREIANSSGQTDVLIHHGSTDTPAIDLVEVGIGLGLMVDNMEYGQFAGYFGMAPVNYILQVRDETGMTKIAAYSIPLANMGLQGQAINIIASGFLEPGNNSDGPEFGLYLVKASGGDFIKFPLYDPKARIQIINNSADTSAAVVDVWLNQTLILDDFAFRTASPFMDAPANEQFTISIKGPNSSDPYNPIFARNYTLVEGETYLMIADGILSDSGYTPPKTFDIVLYGFAKEEADQDDYTDMLFHHGATDVPMIDVSEVAVGAGVLFNDVNYKDFSGYQTLPALNYLFEVRDAATSALLGTFRAPFDNYGYEGLAITIVASGFMMPENNSDGPAFGLWTALPTGGPLVELIPYVPLAKVQFVNNSADEAADVLDVWVNNSLIADNLAFRAATAFLSVAANSDITISINNQDSQNPDDPLWSQSYTLTEDENYIFVLDGILSPTGYDPAKPFGMSVYEGALTQATGNTVTDVLVHHGATDAPAMDMIETTTGAGTLVDNISYGQFDGYLELETANYSFKFTDESGATDIAFFDVNLSDMDMEGRTITLLASGFLDPASNSDGAAFALMGVLENGNVIIFTNTLGIDEPNTDISGLAVFPNPASTYLDLTFDLKNQDKVSVIMTDLSGKIVIQRDLGSLAAGLHSERIGIQGVYSGCYLITLKTGTERTTEKIIVP